MLLSELINSFSEDELCLLLSIINTVNPISFIHRQFEVSHLKWLKKDILIKHLLDSFQKINPEGHETFKSLMLKLDVKVDINKIETPKPPAPTSSIEAPKQEITGSVEQSITSSIEPK